MFDIDDEELNAGKLVQQKCVKKTGSGKVSAKDRFVLTRKTKEGTCPPNMLKNNEWARHTFET